ncbi:hypothetical protein [Neorhizobium galegae]|uniref:hypothetical protein n=1 Tax=Neorhizobium galegae TaxID=399 RepID=UPI000621B68A|nr:hypothetical protein [Neorhizobium galegae]KAB1126379.1 hypothetical protein F4V90_04490 [Neorhizobium galegae]MCQ1805352.1 hypothetical protein [Neorhizobium galegae]CDZ56115.1 Hypothetical protein NGAL_HAMBI2566_06650 [Neorhizobium galegae bv. orientalis]
MLLPINAMSAGSVSLLFGASNAPQPTARPSPASALLGEVGGSFDSALRTGNAIGTIIEIAARMSSDDASSKAADALQIYGAKGTYTKKEADDGSVTETFTGSASQIATMNFYDAEGTYTKHKDADGNVRETFTGVAAGYNDEDWQEFWLETMESALERGVDPASLDDTRAFATALKDGIVEKYDMAKMGVNSWMEAYSGPSGSGAIYKVEGMQAFLEKNTETRDGVMYDKASGKHATWGVSGSKYSYFVW